MIHGMLTGATARRFLEIVCALPVNHGGNEDISGAYSFLRGRNLVTAGFLRFADVSVREFYRYRRYFYVTPVKIIAFITLLF